MDDEVFVGMAVTSRRNRELSTATFQNVSVNGDNAAPPAKENAVPQANDDVFTLAALGSFTVDVETGVLANDTDADGTALTATLVGDPSHGSVALNADGSFTYTPHAGFTETDTFTYVANDGTDNSMPATVTINLDNANNQPPAGEIDLTSLDIGDVETAGSVKFDDGVYTVAGSGDDIRRRDDSFQFAYQQISGDVDIIAQVTSQTRTSSRAKAGVMIRGSLNDSALHATMAATPSRRAYLISRTEAGENSDEVRADAEVPVWVRLVRQGDTLTGYVSEDGATWEEVDSVQVDLPDEVYVGLAVTSRRNGEVSTATFENVSINAGAPTAVTAVVGQHSAGKRWTHSNDCRVIARRSDRPLGRSRFGLRIDRRFGRC